MTDKQYNATVKRVRKAVQRWEAACGMRWYQRAEFTYCRDSADMASARGVELNEGSRDVAGAALVVWKYRQADFFFNLERMESMTDAQIDYTVRHEICHALVNQMREWDSSNFAASIAHEEHVVTNLAMVLDWVRTAGRNEHPKRNSKSKS